MASEISTYLANAVLSWAKGTDMPAAPAVVYVGLHTGNCGPDGIDTEEVTTTIRPAGRVAITFGDIVNRVMSNSAAVNFGDSVGEATVGSASIWTANSGGLCLGASELPGELVITVGLPVRVQTDAATFGFPI